MPSSALGSRGIEELGEALGPQALGLLARQNIQCATTVMARRMPFMTHVVRMMVFELWWVENTLMSHKNTTSLMRSILRVFHICTLGRAGGWLHILCTVPAPSALTMYITVLTGCHQYNQYKHSDPLCLLFLCGGCMQGSCVRTQIGTGRLASSQRISDF